MNIGNKPGAIIKKLASYLMIELFVPGGTLVILGVLFFGGCFPGFQERVLGVLPKSLGALVRHAESTGDPARAHPILSTNAHSAEV